MSKTLKKSILLIIIALGILFLGGTVANAATMSDEFKSYLNKEGKFEMNSAVPTDEDYFALMVDRVTYDEEMNWNGLQLTNVAEDYSECDLTINGYEENEETHRVKLQWNYDETANKKMQDFVKNKLKDKTEFKVCDLELVNYWANNIQNGYKAELVMYSGELKSLLNYGNIEFDVSVGGGGNPPFQTEEIAKAYFGYAGSTYHVINCFGGYANHIIYVPTETENTAEAIGLAAQKRIDNYLGDRGIEVTYLSTAKEHWISYFYEVMRDEWTEEDPNMTLEEFAQKGNAYMPSYPSFEEGFEYELGLSGVSENDLVYSIDILIDENTGDSKYVIIRRDSSKMVNPVSKTADLNTEIEISTAETIPLDTIIQAKELTEGTEYEKIVKILNVTDHKTFDLKLYSNSLNEYITELDNGNFEVKIPIPEEFKGKDLIVYYVDENNKVHDYEVTPEGDYAVYTTDHFSIYTLAVIDEDESDTNNNTNINNNTNKGDKDTTPPTGVKSAINYVLIGTIIVGAGIVILKKKIQ